MYKWLLEKPNIELWKTHLSANSRICKLYTQISNVHMCIFPGPASQDAVIKCVYASPGLQWSILLRRFSNPWSASHGGANAVFTCVYGITEVHEPGTQRFIFILGYIKYVRNIPWVGTKPTVWGVQFPLYFTSFYKLQTSCILNRGREKFDDIASKIW